MAQNILIVENEPSAQARLRSSLRGHTIEFVQDGREAIKTASQSPPAIIVIKVKLPHASGFEIGGMLKACRATKDIPVIYMASSSREAQGLPECSDFIIKKADPNILKERIDRMLKKIEGERTFHEVYDRIWAQFLENRPAEELTESESEKLREGGFPIKAKAKLRPIEERVAEYITLVSSSLSAHEAASRLGVNTSRIRQRLISSPRTLYGIRKNGEWRLPPFQFEKTGLVPNIDKVIARLDPKLDPVAVNRWLKKPNSDLIQGDERVSPLDWLRQGLSWEAVADLAEDL
jgi:DNA-binding response OmpR family regulator